MKCIRCQTDSKYSERSSGACPKCRAKFAFEPKNGDPFTDAAFAGAIDRVSAHDSVRYTEANLFYELARKQKAAPGKVLAVAMVAILTGVPGAFLSIALKSFIPIFALFTVGAIAITFLVIAKPKAVPALTYSAFQDFLARWKATHGTPTKLVQRVAPTLSKKERKALPKELATYSFDRAVICDRPETVDLLLANNFHFENNCAVLSVTHYPEAVFASVLEMLRRNPRIEVYALHDASVKGHGLARHLATSPEWFRGIGRVTDVGILVRHAANMRGLWREVPKANHASFPDLSAAENAWVSQYELEIAAIRPEQIIKRLFRAMTQPGTQVDTGDGGFFFIGGSFGGSDAGTSDGGGDSFG